MATFKREDADIALVLFKTGREGNGTVKYRIAPYVFVTYDDGTSGIMPNQIPSPTADYGISDLEYDRIEVYDGNPNEFTGFHGF